MFFPDSSERLMKKTLTKRKKKKEHAGRGYDITVDIIEVVFPFVSTYIIKSTMQAAKAWAKFQVPLGTAVENGYIHDHISYGTSIAYKKVSDTPNIDRLNL